ncbi:MAG: SNF2-related protein [Gammaproteobacteria bacterium]|nr:SNF2-related protein [Gammaproteobacteria bacterium]
MPRTTPKTRPRTTRKSKTPRARPRPTGWLTTDADEVERRRLRAEQEPMAIEPVDGADPFFGDFRVQSGAKAYRVEIRSLGALVNSCDCADHRVNGLGTCKHVEAVLQWLGSRQRRAFVRAAAAGSPWFEVYLDRRDQRVHLEAPHDKGRSRAGALLAGYDGGDGILAGNPLDTLPALLRAVDAAHPATRRRIRISPALRAWLEEQDRCEERRRHRQHVEAEIAAGRLDLNLVHHALYPYQQEGMLHLALTGRALLADEMGLGKTVQAVAACELLRRSAGIRRVLVVSPASLKGEWEEQIAKFTTLPSRIIHGPRAEREREYAAPAFFYLANYEQIRPDVTAINTILAPDVVILDEAQRIKNWQTRTAAAVKSLQSPYAFVLTGTPVENRIDEIYSIAEFLDPHIFGPLFRFNRDFYQLDDKGRAIGYQNLDQLHERLRPVMLRRRKDEVEGQLPGRTINTYFVPARKPVFPGKFPA